MLILRLYTDFQLHIVACGGKMEIKWSKYRPQSLCLGYGPGQTEPV